MINTAWPITTFKELICVALRKNITEKININGIQKNEIVESIKQIIQFVIVKKQNHIQDFVNSLAAVDDAINPEFLKLLFEKSNKYRDQQLLADPLVTMHASITDISWDSTGYIIRKYLVDEKTVATFDANKAGLLNALLPFFKNDINAQPKNTKGGTPLTSAAISFRPECVKTLLKQGADAKFVFFNGDYMMPSINYVVSMPFSFDFSHLIDNPRFLHIERTFLHTLRLFLEYGANVNAKDELGLTPLAWAAVNRFKKLFIFLICVGADPKIEYDVNIRETSYSDLSKFPRPKDAKGIQVFQFAPRSVYSSQYLNNKEVKEFYFGLTTDHDEKKIKEWIAKGQEDRHTHAVYPHIPSLLNHSIFVKPLVRIVQDYYCNYNPLHAPINSDKITF